jgi:hypothetical protein
MDRRVTAPAFNASRHPHQVLFLVTLAAAGVSNIVAPQNQSPVAAQLLGGHGWPFYGAVGVAALVTLAGVWMRSLTGMLLENLGMLVLAALCIGYAIAALAVVGPKASLISAFTGAYAVACLVRAWQIRRELQRIRRVLEASQ